ncbi:MAG: hypothetical protein IJO55_06655 [Lachnospiraceae bacterium]|nr:hypothetical protein [Lachnospiraceae bacterium]
MSNTAEFSVAELRNGTYTVNVEIEGGNGTDMICTPMHLFIDDGEATAVIVWSTSACEYMKLEGTQISPMSRDDGSVFYLPVDIWDEEVSLLCGMDHEGTKEEIEYVATFDSSSVVREKGSILPLAIMFTLVGVLAVANAYVMVKKRNRFVDHVETPRERKRDARLKRKSE